MSKKKQTKEKPIHIAKDLGEVYDRIMYRGASIPSCESRRLLQRSVDCHYDDGDLGDLYSRFIGTLMWRPDRNILLSEIVAVWLISEFGPMAKDAKAKAAR